MIKKKGPVPPITPPTTFYPQNLKGFLRPKPGLKIPEQTDSLNKKKKKKKTCSKENRTRARGGEGGGEKKGGPPLDLKVVFFSLKGFFCKFQLWDGENFHFYSQTNFMGAPKKGPKLSSYLIGKAKKKPKRNPGFSWNLIFIGICKRLYIQ